MYWWYRLKLWICQAYYDRMIESDQTLAIFLQKDPVTRANRGDFGQRVKKEKLARD